MSGTGTRFSSLGNGHGTRQPHIQNEFDAPAIARSDYRRHITHGQTGYYNPPTIYQGGQYRQGSCPDRAGGRGNGRNLAKGGEQALYVVSVRVSVLQPTTHSVRTRTMHATSAVSLETLKRRAPAEGLRRFVLVCCALSLFF